MLAFRKRKVSTEAENMRRRVSHWAIQIVKHLGDAEPEMPRELNDRQLDVCEPLVAIADLAGGEWPERARLALTKLLVTPGTQEDSYHSLRLLSDVRSCFDATRADRLKSWRLLDMLKLNEDAPGSEFSRGFPLTTAGLARLLKPFDIHPRDLRFEDGIFKGYQRSDFEDAWARNLPPHPGPSGPEAQQGQQASVYAGSSDFSEGQLV